MLCGNLSLWCLLARAIKLWQLLMACILFLIHKQINMSYNIFNV